MANLQLGKLIISVTVRNRRTLYNWTLSGGQDQGSFYSSLWHGTSIRVHRRIFHCLLATHTQNLNVSEAKCYGKSHYKLWNTNIKSGTPSQDINIRNELPPVFSRLARVNWCDVTCNKSRVIGNSARAIRKINIEVYKKSVSPVYVCYEQRFIPDSAVSWNKESCLQVSKSHVKNPLPWSDDSSLEAFRDVCRR